MKKFMSMALALAFAGASHAAIYNDATGDLNDGTVGDNFSGFSHHDISTVEINNDLNNLYITILTVQDPINAPTDWGNYMVGIDTTAGGDTTGNGWGRPVSMSTGMDFWIGAWVNGAPAGGAQLWDWTGAAWNGPAAQTAVVGSGIQITVALADLGLSVGNTFTFDVFSSGGGGGDGAVDALSSATPSITTWGGSYDTGGNGLQYTVGPEPSTLALLGGAGLLALFRRFRRR